MLKDGQRGQQFCVGRRPADGRGLSRCCPRRHRLDRGRRSSGRRPEDDAGPVYVYLATDVGPAPQRQLVGAAVRARRAGAASRGTLAARDDAELEGLDADDAGRLLLLVWNVAGRERARAVRHRDPRVARRSPGLPGLVASTPVLSRDGAGVILGVEGPRAAARAVAAWTPATPRLDAGSPTAPPCPRTAWSCRRWSASRARTACRSPAGCTGRRTRRPGAGGAQPARRPGGAGAADLRPAAPGAGRGRDHGASRRTSAARPASAGSSCTPTTCTAGCDAFDDVLAAADHLVAAGVADPRPHRGHRPLVRRLPDPGRRSPSPPACSPPASTSAGCRDLHTFYRDTEPWIAAAAVTKYGAPRARPRRCSRTSRRCAGPNDRRAAAGRARRARHERADRRGAPDRRGAARARPAGRVPGAGRRGPRVPPGRRRAWRWPAR